MAWHRLMLCFSSSCVVITFDSYIQDCMIRRLGFFLHNISLRLFIIISSDSYVQDHMIRRPKLFLNIKLLCDHLLLVLRCAMKTDDLMVSGKMMLL